MKIRKVASYHEMSCAGAQIIYDEVVRGLNKKGCFNLGLATGNTMIELYKILARRFNENRIDLSGLHTWNLDEYASTATQAVPHDHVLSYWKYMHEKFFSLLDAERNFKEEQAHFPSVEDPASFDKALADRGDLDLQLLGIGFNGHIAFNEPEKESTITVEDFGALPTRVLPLTQETIDQNTRITANGDASLVPRYAATMGMKQILKAEKELLLACFAEQDAVLNKMLSDNRATPELPASYLLDHKDFTLIYTSDKIDLERFL